MDIRRLYLRDRYHFLPDGLMLANLIQAHFGIINNWPGGSALAIVMMGVALLILISRARIGLSLYTVTPGHILICVPCRKAWVSLLSS